MAQALQDIADMTVNFKRSRGYSLPTFEVNQMSSYNHTFNHFYRFTKLSTRESQQSNLKPNKLKCWHCQDDHLKKDCPIASQQNSSLQSKSQFSKEKQCNCIKPFHKRFTIERHKLMRLPQHPKMTASMINSISSFQSSRI